jgi:hypothetical protein
MAPDDAIVRLARQIDAARKAERLLVSADDVASLRRHGASELHRICADFVSSVNSNLSEAELDLSPAAYAPEWFRAPEENLIQIGSQGRQMQIAFKAPSEPASTEKFAVPYVLEGELRAYNQRMLEHFEIRTLLLFFCVEAGSANWRFFDWRSRRTGQLDHGLLASLMKPLF